MDHQKVYEIACVLKPLYDESEVVFSHILGSPSIHGSTVDLMAKWEALCVAYNEKLYDLTADLGEATNNSMINMQMLLIKDRKEITWTPHDLLNVANYESFNSKLWSNFSGLQRPPTHSYKFG
jgi:hypothetical protein